MKTLVRPSSHPLACRLLLSLALSAGTTRTGIALDVKVDPRATYFHTNQDNSLSSPAIDLSTAGIAAGDCVRLERLGDWDNGPGADTATSLIGVFSRSAVLLARTERYRVSDAADAGTDFLSAPTYYGSEPTDIPEDFAISFGTANGVVLVVPPDAAYLFVCPHDSWYQDNADPDADYKVRILAAAPLEVSPTGSPMPLRFADMETLQWEDVSLNCADTYNVYRGDIEDLSLRQYGWCLQSGIVGNTTTDPAVPPVGRSWFYLVSAKNAVGEGSLGTDSAGQTRASGSACP